MNETRLWKVGDVYYEAEGSISGRPWDIGSVPWPTSEEAQADADDWLGNLSARERERAETHVRKFRVLSIVEPEDDGSYHGIGYSNIGTAETCD